MAYAENTAVDAAKSQADIASLIVKHGATGYQYGYQDDRAAIMFRSHERLVRFVIPLPKRDDPKFQRTETGRWRTDEGAITKAWEAETKRRWRVLYLTIKAKLVAVEDNVASFEEEFLANIVVPGTNVTVYEQLQERLAEAYRTGDPIDLVPSLPSSRQIESGRS